MLLKPKQNSASWDISLQMTWRVIIKSCLIEGGRGGGEGGAEELGRMKERTTESCLTEGGGTRE